VAAAEADDFRAGLTPVAAFQGQAVADRQQRREAGDLRGEAADADDAAGEADAVVRGGG
jgi:hypothetical protein